jgi:hypothetical protein
VLELARCLPRALLPFSAPRTRRPRPACKHAGAPGFPRPDYAPSPGFRTLLTVCSSSIPAGLFHPAHAPGVSPSRALLLRGSRCALRRSLPSWRSPPAPHTIVLVLAPWRSDDFGDAAGARLAFTALLRQRSPSLGRARLGARRARSSPGLSPSPGKRPPHLGPRFRVPPPSGLLTDPFHPAEAARLGPEGAPRSVDQCDGRPASLEAGCPS